VRSHKVHPLCCKLTVQPAGQVLHDVKKGALLYCPDGQREHTPGDGEKIPWPAQFWHDIDPGDSVVCPRGHHLQAVVKPVVEIDPFGQGWHQAELALLYVPAGQRTHAAAVLAPELLCAVPAGHGEQTFAPAAEKEPGGHTAQLEEPARLYVPALQRAHSPLAMAAVRKVPALHVKQVKARYCPAVQVPCA
jgi:hypothetical protein